MLAAWAASPARFREDANAEEDLALGGYRDRVVVELAQNAADAAAREGVPGRLLLRLADGVLTASNTGAPLDAAGVESLSTLRASAKRDDGTPGTVGRFGVGFAAVLAVTDEPCVLSATGAVRWSLAEARATVAGVPALQGELGRRSGQVPALRLPWPAAGQPEAGYDTTVVLPLRDDAARDLVRALLAEVDDALLLALPALAEVAVEVDGRRRSLADRSAWRVVRRSGRLDPALLAGRPTEERDRPQWQVTWAVPTGGQAVPATLHAPTPTDEPVDLPALLIASFPLDPTRRHVAPGPLADFLVRTAAEAYAELAAEADDPLVLVPGPVAAGALDAALRTAVVAALAETPLLVAEDGSRLRPRDAVSVVGADQALLHVLAEVLPGLVADHRALDRLGVRRLPLADVVDQLADLRRDPSWWRGLYAVLPTGPDSRDALGALPVPLADGRLVRGPRGLLLPGGAMPAGLEVLGVRVVHPDAAHPALLRLGAVEATAATLLADPAVRAAVHAAEDAGDAPAVADAVLALVAAAGPDSVAGADWLGDLLLPDDEGELAPARDLALPGSLIAEVAEQGVLGTPSPDLLLRWDAAVLAAVGVLARPVLVRDADVVLDDGCDHRLADEDLWVRALAARAGSEPSGVPPVLPELVAVRDLDVVRDDEWPRVLAALAGDPDLRAAVVGPARMVLGDGRSLDAPSYTAWWLARHARLDGRPPTACAAASATELAGLYDVTEAGLDPAFLAAIGVRTSLTALLADPGGPDELLDRLADQTRPVTDAQLRRLYRVLASLDPRAVSPPERVRVRPDRVVAAADAVVLDAPHHLQLTWPTPPLLAPLSSAAALAEVLDLQTTGG
ncbi:MAG TPA: molecular chaperone Hsp90, partial [Actinomycetes bacterium]